MAFSRQNTVPDSTQGTHTFTAVFHKDPEDITSGSKAAFQTDGDSCPRDLRPAMAYLRKQLDLGNFKMSEVIKNTKGKPIVFYCTLVPKADDSDTAVNWDS